MFPFWFEAPRFFPPSFNRLPHLPFGGGDFSFVHSVRDPSRRRFNPSSKLVFWLSLLLSFFLAVLCAAAPRRSGVSILVLVGA